MRQKGLWKIEAQYPFEAHLKKSKQVAYNYANSLMQPLFRKYNHNFRYLDVCTNKFPSVDEFSSVKNKCSVVEKKTEHIKHNIIKLDIHGRIFKMASVIRAKARIWAHWIVAKWQSGLWMSELSIGNCCLGNL